jgi:mRNA interferase RelE/StbE
MRTVRYTADAAKSLKRHANMAGRLRHAIQEYATDPSMHTNNVRQLVGSSAKRMVVGTFRIIFEESEQEILVTKIGPRGNVYD